MKIWSSKFCLFLLFSFSLVIELTYALPSQPLCRDQDKLALLQFKSNFILDCTQAYDPTSAYPKLNSWKSGDCCTWDGVTCDVDTGRVIGLNLSSSCLYGTFPTNSTLFSLDHLLELNLSGNNFNHSQIPFAIGRLHNLTSLDLSQSFFSGQIPSEMTTLSRLSLLDLSYSVDPSGGDNFGLQLHNPSLENLVRNLTRLSILRLDTVDISSVVPHFISNLTSLKVISLVNCNLQGEFPTSVLQLPNLEILILDYNNNLGGYLPEFQPNTPLRKLSLTSTSFSGELPPSIGNLGNLQVLKVSSSNLFGPIPSSIGNLTKLTYLDFDDTQFKGDLPNSVTNLTQLAVLGLSNLNVNPGILSSWLLKLNKLTTLGLNNMNLGGEIPSVLANLTALTFLELNSNQLRGPLPNWLANLTKLTTMSLDDNQLQGPIPQWLSKLTNLQTLYLAYNDSKSESMFDTILKLPNLRSLSISGARLTFPPNNASTNSTSFPKLGILALNNCNLTEFPQFLRDQEELQFLSLKGNNIAGNIPQWFVNATRESLQMMDLSNNLLTGFEQPPVLLPWSNMKVADFSGNKIQGLLPSPSNSMLSYQVYDNQFSGPIPKQICLANSLSFLDLSYNNLSGEIPNCILNQLAASLQVLDLSSNNLRGTIPQPFSEKCNLKMINLSQNQLEGELPRSAANCMMLEVFDVGENRINDTFPTWLRSLPTLQILVLKRNKFHGKIPNPQFGEDFRSLRIIDLSENSHTGDLPSKYFQNWHAMGVSNEGGSDSLQTVLTVYFTIMGQLHSSESVYDYTMTITNKGSQTLYFKILTMFRVIDFSSNNFTGEIPVSIGDLKGLQALNLSNNNLDGHIPSSLAKISDLEALDLSRNMLSGEIPQELAQLTYLAVFNVSYNRLVGPIPHGQQFDTFDNSSFVGNLAMCGKNCGNIEFPPSSLMRNDETEEDFELIDWIIRLLGCVAGLIVGYIIGKIYIADKHHDWFMETFGRGRKSKTRVKRATRQRN